VVQRKITPGKICFLPGNLTAPSRGPKIKTPEFTGGVQGFTLNLSSNNQIIPVALTTLLAKKPFYYSMSFIFKLLSLPF
jgi:hypothetical protein